MQIHKTTQSQQKEEYLAENENYRTTVIWCVSQV